MSEVEILIKELRECAKTIESAADWFTQTFSSLEAKEPEAKPLTLEQVRAVLADKSRSGFTARIRTLLQKYGADKLSGIDPANYKALLEDVEGLTDAS